jgi:hypothetical protein
MAKKKKRENKSSRNKNPIQPAGSDPSKTPNSKKPDEPVKVDWSSVARRVVLCSHHSGIPPKNKDDIRKVKELLRGEARRASKSRDDTKKEVGVMFFLLPMQGARQMKHQA